MLHCTALSLHCGGPRKNLVGGVMEDGRMFPPHHKSKIHPAIGSPKDDSKSVSLPGFYKRGRSDDPPYPIHSRSPSNHSKLYRVPSTPPNANGGHSSTKLRNGEDKRPKRFLGGLFRRKKKGGSDSISSRSDSDSDGFNPGKRHNNLRTRKKEHQLSSPNISLAKSYPHTQISVQVIPDEPKSLPHAFHNNYPYSNNSRKTKLTPTGSLDREYPHSPIGEFHSLGIPRLSPQHTNLKRFGVSISHDSLPESAYGSINSTSARSSALGMGTRSSSTDTLTKKDKKEALKARVERLRDRHKGSSSDEDRGSLSSQYGSESSLSMSSNLGKRSRAARTERYLRRKSYELETLRVETEKDRRNKEAVQARILEIQRNQQGKEKPRWSARLVYQESNEFDSVVIGTPPESPASCHRVMPSQAVRDPRSQNTGFQSSINYSNPLHSLNVSGIPCCRRSFQDGDSFGHGNIRGHRSVSYDSNINTTFSPTRNDVPCSLYNKDVNSYGHAPPPPPPRDRSKLFSPKEPPRPMSYSFESISKNDVPSGGNALINVAVPFSQSSPAYAVAKLNSSRASSLPMNSFSRSLSERQLNNVDRPDAIEVGSNRLGLPKLQPISNKQDYKPLIDAVSPKVITSNSPASPPNNHPASVIEYNTKVKHGRSDELSSRGYSKPDSLGCSIRNELNHNGVTPEETRKPSQKSLLPEKAVSESSPKLNGESKRKANEKLKDTDVLNKAKPEPPKRNSSSLTRSNREFLKQQLLAANETSNDVKENFERQKLLEAVYQKERERLQKSRCTNFEEALQELEEIYKSLNLNNEDIMEGAERRDRAAYHQENSVSENSSFTDRAHASIRRSCTPDKKMDDLHYRRCQMSNRIVPDNKKESSNTGSYLLVSPAHVASIDVDVHDSPKSKTSKEPDIIFDDYLYRNIQRANAVKVIDPQPPFGIPLGPITQGSSSDYLHSVPGEETSAVNSKKKKEPDIVTDDLAFRNLRKDGQSVSNKSLNMSELDDLLTESSGFTSKRMGRSASADRTTPSSSCLVRKWDSQTPRRVKHHNKSKKRGKFIDSYKEAITDSEAGSSSLTRKKLSWVERANLDSRWGSFSTSTETLCDTSRATSQPDIRQAIIRESMSPTGGHEMLQLDTPSHPLLVKVHSVPNTSARKMPCKPLDVIFNTKPKPFYLTGDDKLNLDKPQQTSTPRTPVDITKLDDLISTLPNFNQNENNPADSVNNEDQTQNELINKPLTNGSLNLESKDSMPKVGFFDAKSKMHKAVGLSKAMESSNSEEKTNVAGNVIHNLWRNSHKHTRGLQ